MNHKRVFFCLFAFLCIAAVSVHADKGQVESEKPSSQEDSVKVEIPADITKLIVGQWKMAPNKRAIEGSIIFLSGGSYEMHEKLVDGSGVGTKGEYKINKDVTPVRIDLCLDKCGKPGSEWTTRFGILRVLSNDKLEIRTSPDQNHPKDFSDDKAEEYTIILTRME